MKIFSVKAFSLVEMLVVLVLSSMVIGIIYFSFFTVSSYSIGLTRKYTDHEDLSAIFFLLKKDFMRSKWIKQVERHELDCLTPDQSKVIRYSFRSGSIVRSQNGQTDTFHCNYHHSSFRWKNDSALFQSSLIDELQLELDDFGESLPVSFYKDYDAASLIEFINTDTLRERN